MSYSALFTAGLLEHVERSPSPASRSPDNTPTPSRSVTPTRLPAANAPAAAAHLRSFLSIEPESARPESFRTGISRFTRDRSDSCTSSCSTSSSFVESPITESLPSSSSSSSLPPVLPPLSPRALSPLSFYEPTPSPKAPAFPRTSTSSPIPRLSTASPASRRRSLPEPKPAPSALLPPSPPPESTIYTRSASIDSRRSSVLADLDIPIKSPLFVPLRIQSDPISPTSEDLYSLRTVSTNYKRVQRSDALARLEANAHIRSFFDDDTDASVFSGKTKSTGYPSVALSIQPRIPGSPLRVESNATTDRRRERKKAEVLLKPVRARETWSKTFLDLGDESVWSYRSRSTPISAL